MEDCWHCNRQFKDWGSLQQHAQSKHPDMYCTRCQRLFASRNAKQQHIANSNSHHLCMRCPDQPDFDSQSELDGHAETIHNGCTVCDCWFDSPGQLTQHDIDEHNLCTTCQTYFDSPSNLRNHLQTHAERTVGCPGCTRKFVSRSAMVLHLEAGTCDSGADSDRVTEIAFDCYQSGKYTCDDNPDFNFKCPTCDTPFAWISGLLQHVEGDSCTEELAKGRSLWKFLNFLQLQI
ncbi:hypothetical protein F5144DRAFT_252547 [Chaetomium tenue]|uniref:Uncharacterized protein n=1 Tax=Chaetomium tenue TaxID=1854479 RepID=A0ACB7PAL1_9PEZI|nr:hypothetical protein F5144DRAFT_252547 [Chaetomium globosum]